MRPPLTACWAQNNTVPWCTGTRRPRMSVAWWFQDYLQSGLGPQPSEGPGSQVSALPGTGRSCWSPAPALWPPAWLFIDTYSWLRKGSSQSVSQGIFCLHLWPVLLKAQHSYILLSPSISCRHNKTGTAKFKDQQGGWGETQRMLNPQFLFRKESSEINTENHSVAIFEYLTFNFV